MSLGTWDPETQTAKPQLRIDTRWLGEFIELVRAGRLTDLALALGEARTVERAGLMQLEIEDWQAACAEMDEASLLDLIRFFTLAEQLPGWQAGHRSPVIPLARMLRQRGTPLDRDMLLWIRQHSDNRYLPHGKLL